VACPVIIGGPNLAADPWIPGPIVVGLDGVQAAGRLLGAASTFAATLNVPLWMVQVMPPRAASDERGAGVETTYLEQQARPMKSAGLAIGWDVLHGADAATELLDFARSHEARLVGVATRARTGMSGMVRGSVARSLLQTATMPVLITHVGD
jgi:nucleotide-binding universal stress UspA family protein